MKNTVRLREIEREIKHLFTTVSFQIPFSFLICSEEGEEEKIAWQRCIWHAECSSGSRPRLKNARA